MSKISKSPDRHTFQRDNYVQRQQEKGEAVNEDYLAMFEDSIQRHKAKFEDPADRIENMEYDLLTTDWILEKVRESDVYAQNLYASMCNRDFIKHDVIPILKNQRWSCSWRYAGGIVADMQEKGDYIDWYCSGIRDTRTLSESEFAVLTEQEQLAYKEGEGYVGEGIVTDEIREDLFRLGWIVQDDDMDD
jgi:hypothetical protein